MTKKILISFGLIIAIIGCSVLFVVVYKAVKGSGIEHFKQYAFICQGRINVYKGEQTTVDFYFLDEKELSEMSSKENITAINLYTAEGEILSVYDWEIEDDAVNEGFNPDNIYHEKILSVMLTFDKSVTLCGLEMVYPDLPEYFDIGTLKVNAIERSDFEMFLTVMAFPRSFEVSAYKPGVTQFSLPINLSMLYFNIMSLTNDFELIEIDMGVPGVGIDTSSLKEYMPKGFTDTQPIVSFGEEFTLNPDYEIYLEPQIVDVLPAQNVSILVEKGIRTHAIVSLCVTDKYVENRNNYFIRTYYSPLFTFVDVETQTVFQFSYRNFASGTFFYNKEIVENILNTYGV